MKNGVFDDAAVAEMFDHNALQKLRRDARVPDAFRVHDDDRPTDADAEARRLAALHSSRPEEKVFTLEELREETIQRSAPTVG